METIVMKGKGKALEAIERVCDKRYARGATPKDVIAYLDHLIQDTWAQNKEVIFGIKVLRSYWLARMA